jgi:hypothetical protein
VGVTYIDAMSPKLEEYPVLRQAIEDGKPVPLVLAGEELKTPAVLSFAWVVNELRRLGVVD